MFIMSPYLLILSLWVLVTVACTNATTIQQRTSVASGPTTQQQVTTLQAQVQQENSTIQTLTARVASDETTIQQQATILQQQSDLLQQQGALIQQQATAISALNTNLQTVALSIVPAGTITSFGGKVESIPNGYLLCDGSSVSRITYSALWLSIGPTWGTSPDTTLFILPDLRGQFLRGADLHSGRDPAANDRVVNTFGDSPFTAGSFQASQFTEHYHNIPDPGHTHSMGAGNFIGVDFAQGGFGYVVATGSGGSTGVSTTGITHTYPSGSGQETRPLNVAVTYIIKY